MECDAMSLRQARSLLEHWGLLLLQDAHLPNLALAIAGTPIRGSWWAHPAGHAIFAAANELADDGDVLMTKLVSGKVTFVHRRLWPFVIAVGSARRPWQLASLSPASRALLEEVDNVGTTRASGRAAKELEAALLVASHQVHTETGAHALELTSWKAFATRAKLGKRVVREERARAELERLLATLNSEYGARARLPWQARGAARRSKLPRV